jgi:hypothetical protein
MSTRVDYKQGDKVGTCVFIKELEPKVIPKTEENKRVRTRRRGLFICSCGKEFSALLDKVKENKVSCGCQQATKMKKLILNNVTHGLWKHPLYSIWNGMIQRCTNTTISNYRNYGGRGIKVCDRWNSIELFIEDMYSSYIKGYDLDRIDNNGDYSPDNCRWVTRKDNCNNRRTTAYLEYNGTKRSVSEWSSLTGIPSHVLLKRSKKWKIQEVFTTPYPSPKKQRKQNEK